jgi:tetratricopeptide (TPR) repeat protein
MSANSTSPQAGRAPDGWLREEHPDLYYMLQAVDGDAEALDWLAYRSPGLQLFTRALAGDADALARLDSDDPIDLDDLFGHLDNSLNGGSWTPWLREHRPDWALLFEAIRGDVEAMTQLEGKADLIDLARAVHRRYDLFRQQGPHDEFADYPTEEDPFANGAAADMGCLVGEMHLKKGDYHRAVEAFSRSLATTPSPDVFEGRARAYRALALRDERRAREMRRQAGNG